MLSWQQQDQLGRSTFLRQLHARRRWMDSRIRDLTRLRLRPLPAPSGGLLAMARPPTAWPRPTAATAARAAGSAPASTPTSPAARPAWATPASAAGATPTSPSTGLRGRPTPATTPTA